MQNIGFVKIHRKIRDNPIFWKPNYLAVFMYIILEVEFEGGNKPFRGDIINLNPGEGLFFQKEIADKMGISLGTVSNIIKKLNSENIIEIKTNNKYSIIGLVNWELYQTQVESTIENELKPKGNRNETELKHLKNTKEDSRILKNTKETETISKDTEQAPNVAIIKKDIEVIPETYGNKEIDMMQGYLRKAVGVTQFKDSKERWYVSHCYNLLKKIGRNEFEMRLKGILSDSFKAKNCNKLAYLYGELKSYIHSPIIEPEQKGRIRVTSV